MNDTHNLTSDEQAAAAFAIELSAKTIADCMAVNNTLEATKMNPSTAKGTMAFYGTHYANPENDSFGVAGIVREVLTEAHAVFPRNAGESLDFRPAAIQGSLFTHEIIERAKPKFAIAGLRYKAQAVKNQLSTYGTNEIGKIHLTPDEDKGRSSSRCRMKWYLIKKQQ